MAVAIKQSVDPAWLLQPRSWQSQGWSIYRKGILKQIPGDANGVPIVPIQLDAFEWIDVQVFGVGNTDDALAKLQAYIRAGGSELYAYTLFRKTYFNALGVNVFSYRLLLVHSLVQLLEVAVAILAIAFAAIIFIQYLTTGRSVALTDLQSLWGSGVSSVGQAVGQVGGAISQTYIVAAIGIGVVAIALSSISKTAGVKAPPAPHGPRGSIGVRGGGLSASASS